MTIRELVTWLGFKIDDGTLKEYEKKVESAKKKSADLSNAVGGIGKAVRLIGGAVAAAGITALGKSILDTTGEVEQYRVTLGTMIGDQEKANKIIHDLDYSPVSDFYGTAAAIGGLQGMVTFGMQAEDASEILTRLGDIAQGNGEAFKSLSLNMGQVFAKGKADATDLKQFVGQGFDVVGEVSKMTGKSRAEIEKAGVSYDQCAAALKHITDEGGKYNGMLAKQSKTLPGLIKQFQSLTAAIKEGIGSNVLDRMKDLMSAILNFGRSIQDNIVAVGTKAFEAILDGIADIYIGFQLLKIRMEEFGGAFTVIKALVKDVFGFLESVFQSSRPFILAVAQAILLAFKPIQAFVQPVLEALKPIFKDVFAFAAEIIEQLLPVIDALTPAFKYLGESTGKIFEKLRPIIGNIAKALNAAFKPIQAFVMPVVKALKTLCDSVFNAIGGLLDDVGKDTSGVANVVSSLTPVFSTIGKIVGAVLTVFTAGIETLGPALKPIAYIILGIVSAIKVWTAVQTILNAVMAANPIGLIIIAIVGLIGVITLLVKHWDAIKAALINGAKAVGNFFVGIWELIKNAFITAFSTIGNFFSKIGSGIKSFFVKIWNSVKNFFAGLPKYVKGMLLVLAAIIAPIPMLIIGAILLIKKNWDKIKDTIVKGAKSVGAFFKNIWNSIKNAAVAAFNKLKDAVLKVLDGIKAVWGKLVDFFAGLVEGIKAVWNGITEFFSNLWTGIVAVAGTIWNGIVGAFSAVIEQIKTVWNTITGFFGGLWDGIVATAKSVIATIVEPFSAVFEAIKGMCGGITDFFSGLWDSLKNSVISVADAIGNIFTGLFDGIKNKFFGFIDTFKEGWEKVKGFFGGLWDGAVNFFTGGESDASSPTKVNDMILTPDGTYSTHPDDTIFAMKNPASLVDRIAEFFAQSAPQPSYALAGNSASQAIRQSVNNDYSRHSSSSVFNTPIHVTVNAGGMSAEQARRAVESGVRGALRDAISGSRGVIPSPEARRA